MLNVLSVVEAVTGVNVGTVHAVLWKTIINGIRNFFAQKCTFNVKTVIKTKTARLQHQIGLVITFAAAKRNSYYGLLQIN